MKQKIAIEPNLTPIKDFLSDKGYQVESIEFNERSAQLNDNFDAYVVTGLNTNFLGVNDTETKAVVINASGMKPDQVYKELQQRLS